MSVPEKENLRKIRLGSGDVSAPTTLDGEPVDKEEAARVHAGLTSGEMKVELAPGVAEEMAAAGFTIDDLRQMLIQATKKTMS